MKKTNYKTSHLLIDNPPQSIIDLHRDVIEIGSYLTKFFLACLGRPVDSTILSEPALHFQFVNGILPVKNGPGADDSSWRHSENCYSMLFEKNSKSGKSDGKVRQVRELKVALFGKKEKGKGIVGKKTWDELKVVLEALPEEHQILSLEICQRHYESRDVKAFGKLALSSKSRPSVEAGLKLRELGLLPLDSRGLDKNKLLGILAAVTGRLKSWRDRDCACKADKQALRVKFEERLSKVDQSAYQQFKQFADELLTQEGYRISGRVLRAVEKKDSDYSPVLTVLAKYPDLQDNFEELCRACLAEQAFNKKKADARVTVCSETSPLQFPFGMTGNGYPFTLSACEGRINATIHFPGGDLPLRLRKSKYFQNPEILPVKDGFQITFTRGKTPLVGTIKEPSLLKKNNHYYLSLRVNVPSVKIPKEVRDTRAYYSSAVGGDETTPVPVKAVAIDLGVTTLADYSIIDTCLPGDCKVFGGETAAFTAHGKIGQCANKSLRDRLYKNTEEALFLGKFIRLSKKLRDGEGLNRWEVEKLPGYAERLGITQHLDNAYTRKDEIARKFKQIKGNFDKLVSEFALRDHPSKKGESWETISAETIQVLAALKRIQSLLKSWTYYSWTAEDYVLALTADGPVCIDGEHVKAVTATSRRSFAPCGKAALLRLIESGEIVETGGQYQLATGVKHRNHPVNFLSSYIKHFNGLRRDLTNKLVRAIVNKAQEYRVQIVIVEDFGIADLEDRIKDAYENYRWNLFAPATIVKKLEAALLEVGIAMAQVDPRHTSQIAPTGAFGFRDHAFLYYQDDGLCRIDANTNASMRIAERFFMRHSELTQLRAAKIGETEYLIPESASKRLNAFVKLQTGKPFAKLIMNCSGFVLEGLTKKQYAKLAETAGKKESFYQYDDRWFDKGHHFACRATLENKVQVCLNGGGRIKDTTPDFNPKSLLRSDLQTPLDQLFGNSGA